MQKKNITNCLSIVVGGRGGEGVRLTEIEAWLQECPDNSMHTVRRNSLGTQAGPACPRGHLPSAGSGSPRPEALL